ncbi:MAG TPA: GNAT family N-acetyltransferase [Phenylobacterium sp.]|jgi:GNAT superfamily N-acetyltransferase|nr:GNAT family N-acetyltransferase [Phenylobacterium sp.]
MAPASFEIGPAAPDEALAVSLILQEAARWITTWRAQLWDPALLGEAFVAGFIARGEVLTARIGGEIAGVVIIEPEDPHFWPEHPPGEALYLHKLAVRRAHAGAGVPAALFDRAAVLALTQGRWRLRLDCDAPLAGFYERMGFRKIDEIDVRHPEAGQMRVTRMERHLAVLPA